MAIEGAIFDCDGTLVDSMPMWHEVVLKLLQQHDLELNDHTRALLDRIEPLSVPDKCDIFAGELSDGSTGESLFDELRELVRYEYEHTIQPYPGVKDLLESFEQAGIPMAIATSTGEAEVRVLLETHGMSKYFIDVVSAEDLKLTKTEPTIYYRAQSKIGTPTETTWVFEDAPFGLATAKAAGFPTVCICNGHDGRDEAFLHEHATLFSFEYQNVSLEKLQQFNVEQPDAQQAGVPSDAQQADMSSDAQPTNTQSDSEAC